MILGLCFVYVDDAHAKEQVAEDRSCTDVSNARDASSTPPSPPYAWLSMR
jgi:hypothetical protein